jgi:O-acetyl-ADP-ribose deacetylase (regulator of RNase III)
MGTQIEVIVGNVVDQAADVLISTANPWLNMSGGVNAEIRERGGDVVQQELRDFLNQSGRSTVLPGSVVLTSAGALSFRHVIHAVGIDPFYDSSVELARTTLETALTLAASLKAKTVSLPTIATGYGHLTMTDFAQAFAQAVSNSEFKLSLIRIVLRSEENAELIRAALNGLDPA